MDDFPSPPVDTFSSLPNNALNDAFKMIKYRLQAVILKSGGLGGGHYTAMISYENQWYHCNDRVVKLIPDIQKVLKDLEVQRLIYNVIYERDL